ncbi:ABC transporter substrate-binding protein [Aneurinibacillus terranovensis]|uniref:ABC transporter substrate-binding protein n=1 Tax=Aneurinibacillus terranovensis TaxID=278991 RepID=UPI0004009B6B|nr:ABC transporter substrate-binding protein [Aneurinibacillus terranovensis]
MKKWFYIMLCLSLLLLSGCGAGNANNPGTSGNNSAGSPSNQKLQKISLMLDWYPNAVHSFLYAAQANGYFKEQGLDVDIKMPADTNDPLKLVAAGQIDMAISYEPEVLVARGENIPVQSFGALVRHPLNCLMVPADGPIQSPKDLVGKTVGYPSIPLDEAIVHTMVTSAGGNPQQVKMVDVGFDLIPAMATKKTDALIGGYINHETLLLDKEGHPMRTFNPTKYGVPDYYELVLVAGEKGIKEKPEVFKKFMTAIAKGQKYVQDHPDKGLSILLQHEDKSSPLDKGVETKSLQILLPLMDAKDKPFGYQDAASWENVAKWLYNNKVLKTPVKAQDAFVNF